VRTRTDVGTLTNSAGGELRRFDLEFDVPKAAEPQFQPRFTDTIVRVAEALRLSDDIYHLVYRLPWDDEPVVIPVGPQLQELGERFSLVQAQSAMAGRTAVWLTLGRERSLSEIVDPISYDPEAAVDPRRPVAPCSNDIGRLDSQRPSRHRPPRIPGLISIPLPLPIFPGAR
jgi:hypothetical protein